MLGLRIGRSCDSSSATLRSFEPPARGAGWLTVGQPADLKDTNISLDLFFLNSQIQYLTLWQGHPSSLSSSAPLSHSQTWSGNAREARTCAKYIDMYSLVIMFFSPVSGHQWKETVPAPLLSWFRSNSSTCPSTCGLWLRRNEGRKMTTSVAQGQGGSEDFV